MPGISAHRPEGAFYVYANVAGCLGRTTEGGRRIDSDDDFAMALLEEKYVALVGGGGFGMSPYIRISYATDETSLAEACTRMAAFVAGFR
jgi:aspartate aminotransferase